MKKYIAEHFTVLLQTTNQEVALLRSEIKSREEVGGEEWEWQVEIGKDGVDIVEKKDEELFNVGYIVGTYPLRNR